MIIDEGAEAKIYEERVFGERVIVKFRLKKRYREKELDESIRLSRTRIEAKMLYKAQLAGIDSPRLIALGKYSIYMSYLKGKLLRDCKATGALPERIGSMLARMHNADISHGDFTTANIMVIGGRPFVIDFGLAHMTKSIEDKAIDLLLIKRSAGNSFYKRLELAYMSKAKQGKEITRRLADIEKRGRYQIRTIAPV
ncbi:MAG: KEOPS complex kinase/ATPase Bud32 [Candidatus Micrarchaeia archaeon]